MIVDRLIGTKTTRGTKSSTIVPVPKPLSSFPPLRKKKRKKGSTSLSRIFPTIRICYFISSVSNERDAHTSRGRHVSIYWNPAGGTSGMNLGMYLAGFHKFGKPFSRWRRSAWINSFRSGLFLFENSFREQRKGFILALPSCNLSRLLQISTIIVKTPGTSSRTLML